MNYDLGEVYPHKLEVSDVNPDECRPHLQYPWHADGPPTDNKEEGRDFLHFFEKGQN